jgi:hypothetical protein
MSNLTQKIVLSITGTSVLLTLLISFHLVRKHLKFMSKPDEQRKIIAILYLAPVFAMDSFISLLAKDASGFFELVKDVYEGYVVYVFFSLLVEYLGGEHRVVDLLEAFNSPIYRPWPLSLILPHPYFPLHHRVLGFKFFRSCKVGVMQFVVLRPLIAVLVAILDLADVYERGKVSINNSYIWIEIIVNISVTWAVYCLVCFFVAFHKTPNLAIHDPLPKFLAVKSVVFLSFWQGLLLALLSDLNVIDELGPTFIQNVLICFEMLIASIYHHYAFPWQVYVSSISVEHGDSTIIGLGVQFTQLTETGKDIQSHLFSSISANNIVNGEAQIDGNSMELGIITNGGNLDRDYNHSQLQQRSDHSQNAITTTTDLPLLKNKG